MFLPLAWLLLQYWQGHGSTDGVDHMRKFGLISAGAAGLVASLIAGQAYAVPATGTFGFVPGGGGVATVNTGALITAATTTKTIMSPGTSGASSGPGQNLG